MAKNARCRVFPLVLGLLALMPAIAQAAAPPGIPDGWSDGYVFANGIRIHYYHAPSPGRPVIVMCHGVTDNGLCFANLTWKLQDSYDIYMLDARGHGLTDPNTAADDRDTMVKDVVETVRALKLEKPVLLGHSMGAATVMRVGAEYPDLPKAVIMFDPGLGGGPGGARGSAPTSAPASGPAPATATGAPAIAPARGSPVSSSPDTLIAQNNHTLAELMATCRRQNPKWDLIDCEYWALSKQQYHGTYTPASRQAVTGTMGTGNALAKITAPALILKADASPEVRKANEEAAQVMQHGKLVHIDGAAHNLHHDQLARTVQEVRQFLSGL